jgi:DNA-binding response OmpR family regulator
VSADVCNILIVEDDADTARRLAAFVRSLGMKARIAATLADVEAALAEESFCCVLLDKQIPAAPGEPPLASSGDTAQKLVRAVDPRRNDDDQHLLPILVITGAAAELEERRKAEFVSKNFRDGASAYIPKPFDADTITREIRAALERAGRTTHARCVGLKPRRARPSSRPPVAKALAEEIGARAWGDVELTAVDGHTVRIQCGDVTVRRTYADLGFANAASREPIDKWRVVRIACEERGVFRGNAFGSYEAAKNAVYVAQTILKGAFGLGENPFEYRKGIGWRAKFKVGAYEEGED